MGVFTETWTVEIEAGKGIGIADACRKLGITEQTFVGWNPNSRFDLVYRGQVTGTWQNMLKSPNTEANRKNIAAFYAFLDRQSNPETAGRSITRKEKALLKRLSKGFEAARNDTGSRKTKTKRVKKMS
jgi:hypothetical protein